MYSSSSCYNITIRDIINADRITLHQPNTRGFSREHDVHD